MEVGGGETEKETEKEETQGDTGRSKMDMLYLGKRY